MKSSIKPKILINSLPKSGTNLVTSLLDQIPELKFQKITLNRNLRLHPVNFFYQDWSEVSFVGIDQPVKIPFKTLQYILRKLQDGCYTSGHIPYQENVYALLQSLDIRIIFVIRDPRDIIVSQVHHVLNRKSHFLHQTYKRLSEKQCLMTAITGCQKGNGDKIANSIMEKLDISLPWIQAKSVLTLHFEDIIGKQGGGDTEMQKQAIIGIGRHIDININASEAASIGNQAFGRGNTYRRGQIGSWQQKFDHELKDIFKEKVGNYLIELGYEKSYDW